MLAIRRGFAAIVARISDTPLLLRCLGVFTVGLGILYLAGAYKS